MEKGRLLMEENSGKTKKKKNIWQILSLVFAGIFVFCCLMAGLSLLQAKQEQAAFSELARSLPEKQDSAADEQAQDEAEARMAALGRLQEENPDFTAWLTLPGAGLDYPVMYTPEEPEYYLHRAFDGSYAAGGTPFLGANCDIDSDCCIIYGHNMKNGSMFGNLDKYLEKSFWQDNPAFDLDTAAELREYRIFAVVRCRLLNQDEAGFRYYQTAGDLSDEDFARLCGWLMTNSLYDTKVTPTSDQQIVILSTCSYHTDNGRFIVAGCREQ